MNMEERVWAIYKNGRAVISFTSLLDCDLQSDSAIPEEPLEKGSFASYNRTQQSKRMRVRLAIEGDSADLQRAQETLEELKSATDVFSLVTPDYEHENLALESYSYTRNQHQGAGLLIVDLRLKEIREVQTGTATLTVASCKDASDVSKVKTGRTQTREVDDKTKKSLESGAYKIREAVQKGLKR